jgi:hypothetical protein
MPNTFRATTVLEDSDTSFTHPGIPSDANSNNASRSSNANAEVIVCQDKQFVCPEQGEKKSTSSSTPISCSARDEHTFGAHSSRKSATAMRMKVLIVCAREDEVRSLREGLEDLNHRVLICSDLAGGAKWLRDWRPDLLITEENLARGAKNCGLRLAELCRTAFEQGQGSFRTQALILVPIADWDRIKRAQGTGAHVIVKSSNFDAVVRYVQTIADNVMTDRILGPILFGVHRFRGEAPLRFCRNCEWVGASLSYGMSQTDISLTPVRAVLLNCLLFSRRGLSPGEIVSVVNEHPFLQTLLKARLLQESAIKMEIARLRRDIGLALGKLGAPYEGSHFIPPVPHSAEKYRLSANWQLSHVHSES